MIMNKSLVLLPRSVGIKPLFKCRSLMKVSWSETEHENDPKKDDMKYKPLFFDMLHQAEAKAKAKKQLAKKQMEIIKNISFQNEKQTASLDLNASVQRNKRNIEDNLKKKNQKLKISNDLSKNKMVNDPMPPFTSVAQRLLDLNDRRIHPLYIKMGRVPIRAADDDKAEKPEIKGQTTPKQKRINQQPAENKRTVVHMNKEEPTVSDICNDMKQKLTQIGFLEIFRMFLTNILLKKVKSKSIMVQMESVVSGHTFNKIRERLAEKLECVRFDPRIQQECLYREKKKVRSMR